MNVIPLSAVFHEAVPRRSPDDKLAVIDGQINRYSRMLKALRARRAAMAPDQVKRKGKRMAEIVFEVNGSDIAVTLRREKVMHLLLAAEEGQLVPLAEIWAIYGGSAQWARNDLCKFNKLLAAASARIDCERRCGYRLVNV